MSSRCLKSSFQCTTSHLTITNFKYSSRGEMNYSFSLYSISVNGRMSHTSETLGEAGHISLN